MIYNKLLTQPFMDKIVEQDFTESIIIDSLEKFKNLVEIFNKQLDLFEKVSMFGAAQMLPVLLYHINNDKLNSGNIYDNNVNRIGCKYPNSKMTILKPSEKSLEGENIIISALDSYRPIYKKLIELNPKRIINILNIS